MLLMHNLNVHRKAGITRRKISSFLGNNILENEILYSSDSECEYRITTTIRRIAKIKPEIKAANGSDDDDSRRCSTARITRSGSFSATVKRETLDVDRDDGGYGNCDLSCKICGFIADTVQVLEGHTKSEHDTAKDNCEISFPSCFGKEEGNVRITESQQSDGRVRWKKFFCDVCGKHFKQKATLAKHMEIHSHNDDADEDDPGDVAEDDDASENYDTDDSYIINSEAKSTCGFPCAVCGKIYVKKEEILEHFKSYHPHDNDALLVTIDVMDKHEGLGFPCTSCPTVHSNRNSLHRHLRTAHQIPNDNKTSQFNCHVCAKVFYRPKCFATHLKKHNDTMKMEKQCRSKNPKKKTHLCSFCGKSYPGSNHLKIHLRVHTGERPFKCQYCDKTFAIKKTWQDHTYSHTGEKPYFCPIENCGKRFTHSTGVRQHMQCCHSSEKQFQCPHCDKKCSKKTHLEDHIRSHTGERPYECKYCGIRFRLTSTLRIHHRTHTGERPFVCKVCNRGFIKSYGLKQHMKSKRNCLPAYVQPTLIPEIDQQQEQPVQQLNDNDATEDVQFHQLLILPAHQVLS